MGRALPVMVKRRNFDFRGEVGVIGLVERDEVLPEPLLELDTDLCLTSSSTPSRLTLRFESRNTEVEDSSRCSVNLDAAIVVAVAKAVVSVKRECPCG